MGDIVDGMFEDCRLDWTPRGRSLFNRDIRPAFNPRCRHCNLDCTWHHTGERWRLMGPDGRLHSCSKPASADDFEDVS